MIFFCMIMHLHYSREIICSSEDRPLIPFIVWVKGEETNGLIKRLERKIRLNPSFLHLKSTAGRKITYEGML